MTKILLTFASTSEVKGGSEVFSEHLKKTFPDLVVINYNSVKNSSQLSKLEFPPLREPLRAFVVDKYLLKQFEKNKPELIFVNGMYGWHPLFKKIKVPIVCILHGGYPAFADTALPHASLDYYRTKYIYGFFEKASARNASVRISNSGFTQNQIKKYYGLDSEVIYNAIDTETFRPLPKADARESLALPQNEKIAIFVGRPDYSKGFDIILKLAEIHKDITFLCVINPPIKSYQKNLVIKTGVVQGDLPSYYSAADFLIFPSRFEGFGYVPLEALACNTPIISSKTGILTEINPPGSYIVKENNYKNYIDAIAAVSKSKEAAETYKYVKENFSFVRFSSEYRELAESLIMGTIKY